MSTTWGKWYSAALVAAFVAVLAGGPAMAGKPAKPPKDDGETPRGTIFFWTVTSDGAYLVGMDGDGNNMYEAAPHKGRPSHFAYGEDDHRWFLSLAGNGDEPSVPFWFTESYPDGDPRWEVAVLRPDPSLPFGGEWIQLTDLYAPTEEDPFNIVEMLCATHGQLARPTPRMVWGRDDEFVSFLGVDWRQWPNPTRGIFRIPITALEIELLREDTPLRSFDDLETVVTIPNSHCEGFAWSPLGDKVAFCVSVFS
jgi:hypothetical protein